MLLLLLLSLLLFLLACDGVWTYFMLGCVCVCVRAQYSVTSSFRPAVVNGMRQSVLPGVFWVYDLSPFMVDASTYHTPLFEFVTGLCAIIGGVLTVM